MLKQFSVLNGLDLKNNSLLLVYVIIVNLLTFQESSNALICIIFFLLLSYHLLTSPNIFNIKPRPLPSSISLSLPRIRFFLVLSSLSFLAYLSGVVIGFYHSNQFPGLLFNYAGMATYLPLMYLIYRLRPSPNFVLFLIFLSICIQFSWALYYILNGIFEANYILVFDSTFSSRKIAYSAGFTFFLVPLLALLSLLYPRKLRQYTSNMFSSLIIFRISAYMLFLLPCLTLLSIFPAVSKGFFLAIVFSYITPLVFWLIHQYSYHVVTVRFLFYLIFVSIALLLLLSVLPVILDIYSDLDTSNASRSIQYNLILDDLPFFGNGLGATLKGFSRDNWGIENSYIGIIHKLGILSFLVFPILAAPILIVIKKIILSYLFCFDNFLILGLLLYMIPSLGNPILFHSVSILQHCFALYLLSFKPNTAINFA